MLFRSINTKINSKHYVIKCNFYDDIKEEDITIIVDFDTKQVTFQCFEIGYIDKKGKYINKKRQLYCGKPKGFITLVEEKVL